MRTGLGDQPRAAGAAGAAPCRARAAASGGPARMRAARSAGDWGPGHRHHSVAARCARPCGPQPPRRGDTIPSAPPFPSAHAPRAASVSWAPLGSRAPRPAALALRLTFWPGRDLAASCRRPAWWLLGSPTSALSRALTHSRRPRLPGVWLPPRALLPTQEPGSRGKLFRPDF